MLLICVLLCHLNKSTVFTVFTVFTSNHYPDTYMSFVDFSKAFDFVQREFIFHKRQNLEVIGNLYTTIKSIYTHPVSCIVLNGLRSQWFKVGSGVRQGDSSSPILFALFINDLGQEMNELNRGIDVGQHKLNLLMYGDDIFCLAPGHTDAHAQMDVLRKWCLTWGMFINVRKTQVIHVRHHQK